MKPFEFVRAATVAEAVEIAAARSDAQFLGGGTNLVDHMKLNVADPGLLVDVSRLPATDIVVDTDGVVRIGGAVRNSDLAAHPVIRARYPALSRALLSGASPQLRNLATTAGNLMQRTRCVYFQDVTTPCNKRQPGSGCSAIGGYVRYHAVFGTTDQCVAVHPSDMAVAMVALDAHVVVQNADGERRIPVEQFHRLPGDRPDLDTVLRRDELITGVELPPPPRGARSTYRKVRDRASYAFALVSVAAELTLDGDDITDARIALGGVAHKPWRARGAEESLRGAPANEDSFRGAAAVAFAEAKPLEGNEFKAELGRRTLVSALREVAGMRR